MHLPRIAFLLLAPLWAAAQPSVLFIGTGGKDAKGIYRTKFNQDSGSFSKIELAAEIDQPGFLALHPNRNILYAVARWDKQAGVIGYLIEKGGELREFTRSVCSDGYGCHLAVHPSGRFLLSAQYAGGSIALFPLDDQGIADAPSIIKHHGGSGVTKGRQDSPHPHWCGFSPAGTFALVPDLGLDRILIYRTNPTSQVLSPHGHVECEPGGGPRHMRFSACGKFFFLLNELSSSVSLFSWLEESGSARLLSTTPALSQRELDQQNFNSAAEILVHPNGRRIYTSNRGHDSVTTFAVDPPNPAVSLQTHHVRGAFPRNVTLSPNAEWLLAAGQHSNTISAHRIQPDGTLVFPRGSITNAPSPICLLFVP